MRISKISKILIAVLVLICLFASVNAAAESYTYSATGKYQHSPDAMEVQSSYTDFGEAGLLNHPVDVEAVGDKIYIADKGNNRIVILNSDMSLYKVLDSFVNSKGEEEGFNAPQGVFVAPNGDLYVADTMNGRIAVFDKDLNFKKITAQLSEDILPDGFIYQPAAVAVNEAGRMFIISLNTNMGVMMVSAESEFEGFIGAQRVSTDAFELMRRMFMSEEQLERSTSFVPVEYSNITIDEEGFVYVTSSSINSFDLYGAVSSKDSAYAPIKKLNPSGTDVLCRYGFTSPVGVVDFDPYGNDKDSSASALGEVCLLEHGQYLLVDTEHESMFTYDSQGNLLYAFGGSGESEGRFSELVSASFNDGKLYVLDELRGEITVFEYTEYGELLNEVCRLREKRDYEGSSQKWNEIIKHNNNFDVAYLGIGKDYLDRGDYTKAMEYFKLIDNRDFYMRAFEKQRQLFLNKYGMLIFVGALVILFAVVKLFGVIGKYNEKKRETAADLKLKSELLYAVYAIFHPFKAFYEIKYEKRASVKSASVITALATAAIVFNGLSKAYGLKSLEDESVLALAAGILLPVALWCISNWCFTSLMDGKGKMTDIFTATAYCLTPIILIYPPVTIISHFVTEDEFAILTLVTSFALLWVAILIFVSNLTIHEYELGKNIIVCILTIVGIAILLFLFMVFFNLLGDIYLLIKNIVNEVSFRS